MNDLILRNATLPGGETATIAIAGQRIAAIDRTGHSPVSGGAELDLRGALVLPGLVDGHIHLDKTYLGDGWHSHRPSTSIVAHVAAERQERHALAPVEQRASALIERAITNGTTILRTHADIDPVSGLSNLDGILAARERYRDAITIQVVAFPQSGIIAAPGTYDLLDEALCCGADLIGGLDPAGFDNDVDGHLEAIFGLADRHSVGVDIHLHDAGDVGLAELRQIAERAIALGMQGRVTVGHAYALGTEPWRRVAPVAEALASAGVSIMTTAPGSHAFPPVLALRAAGVNVFAANDNIRDSWSPFGEADMLERMMLVAYRSGFTTDAELDVAFDLGTNAAARALGIEGYGLAVGNPADLVVLDARHVAEAVVARPPRRYVMRHGVIVAQDGMLTTGSGEMT